MAKPNLNIDKLCLYGSTINWNFAFEVGKNS